MNEQTATKAARVAGERADQVRALFDAKAARWPGKYAAGGPLAGRLGQVAAAVRARVPAGGELLDLGCGSGELARHLAAGGYRVTGCDISVRMLDQAIAADREHSVRWVQLAPGWRVLPSAAGSLDAVIAASVLEYVPNPAEVLAACAHVLRPGGVLLCTVPAVTHPVRWLELPFWLAARTPLGRAAGSDGSRAAQYLAYLRTSRQRHRVGWWRQVSSEVRLELGSVQPADGEPLSLLTFGRPGDTKGQPAPTREAP